MTQPNEGKSHPPEIVERLREVSMLLKLFALGEFSAAADIERRTNAAADVIDRLTKERDEAREALRRELSVAEFYSKPENAMTHKTPAQVASFFADRLRAASLLGKEGE